MHLIQILLPLFGNEGEDILRESYPRIRDELVARFGGLTAFLQSPAEGLWKEGDCGIGRDDIVMVEVMVESLEPAWWEEYREILQKLLGQESIVIRAVPWSVFRRRPEPANPQAWPSTAQPLAPGVAFS